MEIKLPLSSPETILALGPESAGNFSLFRNGRVFCSVDYGDLQDEKKFSEYQKALEQLLLAENSRPDIILTDLHPDYVTSRLGRILAERFNAQLITVQHHLAHIFSAVGDSLLAGQAVPAHLVGIAADGTGLGLDGLIWGGEIFQIELKNSQSPITRIGHLENQTLIGGELAIREPARFLLGILSKLTDRTTISQLITPYYPETTINLLLNQCEQQFNCIATSSTGRVLDATAILLGFSANERLSKHGPTELLAYNSSIPFELEPHIYTEENLQILSTTHLFRYLLDHLTEDHARLAATAQHYLAQGLYAIAAPMVRPVFFSGGMANNTIMSRYLTDQGAYVNSKIPRGDAGLSFGQIVYYLLTNTWN